MYLFKNKLNDAIFVLIIALGIIGILLGTVIYYIKFYYK